jgi:hypothetical protein
MIGINKKWNDQYQEAMVKNTPAENDSGTSEHVTNMTNTNIGNRESDHDYGFSPRQNGYPSRKRETNSSTDSLGRFSNSSFGAKYKTFTIGKYVF